MQGIRAHRLAAVAVLAFVVVAAASPQSGARTSTGAAPEAAAPTIRVELGEHTFGQLREAEAVVARAGPGAEPTEVGFECPSEGTCAMPPSFDVSADGTVWVSDLNNHRLVAYARGSPDRPSRTIPVDFAPADVAVGPDGTIYVTGLKPGEWDGMRLIALDGNGRQRWMTELLVDDIRAHIRLGPAGILYIESVGEGIWVPVIDASGQPLGITEQTRLAQSAQPLADGGSLVVTGGLKPGQSAPNEYSVVLSGPSGSEQKRWLITADFELGLSLEAVPTLVDGDPVLVFEVYRFDIHLMEHVVVRLSPAGLVDRMSLGRGGYRGGLTVTDVRVGPDGKVYQLNTNPDTGMWIGRYALASTSLAPPPAPARTSAPNPQRSPQATQPSVSAIPTEATSPSALVASPTIVPGPSIEAAPVAPSGSGPPGPTGPVGLIVAGLCLVAALVAFGAWRVQHARSAHLRG